LVSKGRIEEARRNLQQIRTRDVEDELRGIVTAFELARNSKTKPFDCFRGLNLKRTLIVMGLQVLGLAQGTSSIRLPHYQRHHQTDFTISGTGLNFLLGYMVILFIQIGLPDPFKIIVIGNDTRTTAFPNIHR
jgi:hypothetical protein